MSTQTIAGHTVQVNDEGFMTNPNEWDKDIAVELARKEGNTKAALFFERASLDEARHKAGLKGFLERIKKQQ